LPGLRNTSLDTRIDYDERFPCDSVPGWRRVVRDRLRHILAAFSDQYELDVGYFLKGGLWLSVPILVNHVLGLIRTVAFARLTEQSTYGAFGFVISITGMVGILTLPGISTALAETVARGNLGSLTDAARTRARWGTLGSVLLAGAAAYYAYLDQQELALGLLLAGLLLPLSSSLQVIQAYYSGRKRFEMVSLISSGLMTLTTIALLLALWFKRGLLWLVLINSGVQALFYLLFYLRAIRHAQDAPRDLDMAAYGRSLTWAEAISTVALQLDSVILGFSAGFVDVAVYNIANVFPTSVKSITKTLTPLAMPKIAEKPDKRVYSRQTRRRLLILLLLNLLVVTLVILVLPTLIRLLYGERYSASIPYAQLLMVSVTASWPSSFFAAALQARKQTRAIYHFNLIYGILQVGTLVVFVPLWGILGIVISRIVTRLGAALYQWYAVTRI